MTMEMWTILSVLVGVPSLLATLAGVLRRRTVVVTTRAVSHSDVIGEVEVGRFVELVARLDVGRRPVVVDSISVRPVGRARKDPDVMLVVAPGYGRPSWPDPVPELPISLGAYSAHEFRLGAVTAPASLVDEDGQARLQVWVLLSRSSTAHRWTPKWVMRVTKRLATRKSAPFDLEVGAAEAR